MTTDNQIKQKVRTIEQLKQIVFNGKVVFTNGCFDLLHYGHIDYLSKAKDLGDFLIVGMNSGESISRLKGSSRPILDENSRIHIMASLFFVDYVIVFNEDTPINLIRELKPHILVKGGDWRNSNIVGKDIVESYGGKVCTIPYIEGYSTTLIESKIKNSL